MIRRTAGPPAVSLAAALLCGALLSGALAGCAAAPAPESLAGDPGLAEDPRIMVTLPASQRGSWDRITAELSLAYSLRVYQAWRMRSLPIRCVIFDLPPGTSRELILRRLKTDPRIESAEPIRRYRTLTAAEPEDPYEHLQRGAQEMRVGGAHRWATGRGVRVAVVDTGVDIAHPDLDGRIIAAHNFVDRGEKSFTRDVHGTAVAGVVAATAGNGAGIAGVAPGSFVMALKACWPAAGDPAAAECDSYTLAQALDWGLEEGAQVVNLSLTGPPDPLLARLLDLAHERGVAVVAAAEAVPGFPANHPGVIAVLAAGPGLDSGAGGADDGPLAAPGVDVLTTVPGGNYEFLSGSSMAAAHVSGVVALLLEHRPNLRPEAAAKLLRGSARPAPAAGPAGSGPAGSGPAGSGPAGSGPAGFDPRPGADVAGRRAVVDACGAVAELIGRAPADCAEPLGLARGGGVR